MVTTVAVGVEAVVTVVVAAVEEDSLVVAEEVLVQTKAGATTEDLAIPMGPQIKPANYTGNLENLQISVLTLATARGRTYLHQNQNQINEPVTIPTYIMK